MVSSVINLAMSVWKEKGHCQTKGASDPWSEPTWTGLELWNVTTEGSQNEVSSLPTLHRHIQKDGFRNCLNKFIIKNMAETSPTRAVDKRMAQHNNGLPNIFLV